MTEHELIIKLANYLIKTGVPNCFEISWSSILEIKMVRHLKHFKNGKCT